ncbi:MAG: hypothetical protein HOU01_07605, partial [Streptomycetaceae bacterium]|nr:hypothetical protein [Streptomycetaceae bacterium]
MQPAPTAPLRPTDRRRITVAAVAAVAGFAVTAADFVAWLGRLPDPIATH